MKDGIMPKTLLQLDTEELSLLSASIENNPLKMSALLLPNSPQCQTMVLRQLLEWIVNRKVVLESRAEGSSHISLVFDKVCYRIWQQLPGYARDIKIDIDPDAWLDRPDAPNMREARPPL